MPLESIFCLLVQPLSLKTRLGAVYSADMFQSSNYILESATLTLKLLGWEGFAAGPESFRGSTRGRSGFVGRGGGKYNLDNRTKKVAVTGELSGEKDEALRQYLLVSLRHTLALMIGTSVD